MTGPVNRRGGFDPRVMPKPGMPARYRPLPVGPIPGFPGSGASTGVATVVPIDAYLRADRLNRVAKKKSIQQATIAGVGTIIPVVYGTQRLGARVAAVLVLGNKLILLCVWCHGEVGAVVSYTVNDAAPAAGITATHYTGTSTQAPDPTLIAAFAAKGKTYADALPNVCYSVISVPAAKNAGFPRLAAIVQGQKVRQASGGVKSYSDNPAYAIADFVENTTYGMGRAVDWASVATVAATCDAMVGTPSEKKRLINLSLDSAQPGEAWLAVLADYAGCFVYPEGVSYRLVPDTTGSSVMSFTTANIVAGSMRPQLRGTRDSPTAIEISYTDTTSTPWRDNTVPVYAAGVLAGTKPRRMSRISKPGTTRYSEAYRYAVERLNEALLNDLSISFVAFDEALKLQAGDLIDVTHPIGLSAKLFRVMKIDPVESGRWQISATEYDPAKYSSVVVTGPTTPDTNLPNPSAPPTITGLVLTEDVFQVSTGMFGSRLRATWTEDLNAFPFVALYTIEILQNGVKVDGGLVPVGTTVFVSKQLPENLLYSVSVAIVSTVNVQGAGTVATITNSGKLAKPSDVPLITGYEIGGEVRLQWSPATDLDLTGHELRYGTTASSWSSATLLNRVAAPNIRYETRTIPAGTWRFWIKGLDSIRTDTYPFGQESVNAVYVDIIVTAATDAFVAFSQAFASPYLSNMVAVPDGWLTEYGATWNATYTSNLNTYTNPLATYHAAGNSGLITEVIDVGSVLTGDWYGALPYQDIDGTAVLKIELNSTGGEGAKTITAATNATPIQITATGHGYLSGDEVLQAGVGGNLAANGRFRITVVDANNYTLQDLFGVNIAGNGAYTSGGSASRWLWQSYSSMSVKTSARYGRWRIDTAGTVKVTGLGSLICNVVARSEGGTVTTAASGPTIIVLSNRYNRAVSYGAWPQGTAARFATVDQVEVDGARGVGVGQALRFNGTSDYVDVSHISAINLSQPMTLTCWVRPTSFPGASFSFVRKDTEVGTRYLWGLLWVAGSGVARAQYFNGSSYKADTFSPIALDRLQHLAMTISGTTLSMILDGILQSQVTIAGTQNPPTGRLSIGCSPPAVGPVARAEYAPAIIDEVAIWNVAKTPAQILAYKDTPLVGNEANLVALYHFDSTTGTVATDSTANANHGTVTGAKWRPLNGFDVYAFNSGGTQIAADVSWNYRGV